MEFEPVLRYIDAHRDEYVALLQEMCRQPSQASTGEGIPEMIELVLRSLRDIQMEPVLCETPGNPVIYAERKGESDRIFGFYDHYDVQPVDPIELWDDDPYSAVIRDGVIYARGVADNKNGLASKICAIDAFLKVYGKLPCGVKFFVEGEEEIGSPNLAYFAEHYKHLLDCDGYNWEGGYKNPGGPPEIHLGNKGLLYVEYHVKTAAIDAHSCNAAVVENPAWRLLQALSSLKDEKDHILIDGFYDDVIPVTEDDMKNLEEDNYDEAEQKEYLGISSYINDLTGVELRKKLYYAPTANIAGIISGYTGAGSKTVLPCEASAKMDFRLVPGQDPDKIFELLKAHLHKHGFDDVEVRKLSGQRPFRCGADSVFVKAVIKALGDLFGKPVVHYMIGGTSPVPVFCDEKKIPAAMFGCNSNTCKIHAPNEHMEVESYIDDVKMIAGVMYELGKA